MGISIYRHARSPFWYAAYFCPQRLRRVNRPTPHRADAADGEKLALIWAQEKAGGAAGRILSRAAKREAWAAWVLPWIESAQVRRSPRTRQRYRGAWKFLGSYLRDVAHVAAPAALTYEHVTEFLAWRCAQTKRNGRPVAHNTALCDLKILSGIMAEAVRRGYARVNPCHRLGIAKAPQRHARRLTADELAKIERELPAYIAADPAQRAWMATAYTIARFQGCRLRETRLHLARQVDLRAGRIIFLAKGRDGRPHEFPSFLHDKVRALLERLRREGRTWSLDLPVAASVPWRRFLDSIGLRNAWFHCLRATVATEMAERGVPISLAMRYQGHAKEEIHRAYQDINVTQLAVCAAAVG